MFQKCTIFVVPYSHNAVRSVLLVSSSVDYVTRRHSLTARCQVKTQVRACSAVHMYTRLLGLGDESLGTRLVAGNTSARVAEKTLSNGVESSEVSRRESQHL